MQSVFSSGECDPIVTTGGVPGGCVCVCVCGKCVSLYPIGGGQQQAEGLGPSSDTDL